MLLDNDLILDTETIGLRRGAPIHELATLDLSSGELHEYILKPQLARQLSGKEQDAAKMSASSSDFFMLEEFGSYKDAIRRELELKNNTTYADWETTEKALKSEPDQFIYKKLQAGIYPHLLGDKEDLTKRQAALGPKARLGIQTSLEELLNSQSEFVKRLEGKTVWGMNVGFDSKMLGAHIEAMQHAGKKVGFKDILETQNRASPDPFYVTGEEVNKARLRAAREGDWTPVWQAYKAHKPKPGETAVRDIQDVSRAMFSYGKKLGLIDREVTLGTSLDFMYRLLGSVEDNAQDYIFTEESHRAAEDIKIHSKYVLEETVKYTSALERVAAGDMTLVEQARKGKGDLFKAMQIFTNYKKALPALEEKALRQRIVKASTDIASEGFSIQTEGIQAAWKIPQTRKDGTVFDLRQNKYMKAKMTSMDEVIGFLMRQSSYKNSKKNAKQLYAEMMQTGDNVSFLGAAPAPQMDDWVNSRPSMRLPLQEAVKALELPMKKMGKVGALAIAGFAAMSVVGTMSKNNNVTADQGSMLVQDYQSWRNGLQEQGIGAETRKYNTDFGSPYQGIIGSNNVFIDQELLDEREKYIRGVYGASNQSAFDNVFGNIPGLPKGYNYIQGSVDATGTKPGLKGNYRRIDIDANWKIEAEDADTVILKQGGFMGAAKSFFGMNRGYAFRLGGLDSPEVSHGSGSYKAPQPHAEKSRRILQRMLNQGEGFQLYFNPEDASYGRPIAALYGDGKYINQELIKSGAASALPYGKWEDAMVEYAPMLAAEQKAFESRRGMWREPWAQTYKAITDQTGQKITFNTFARKSRIAENTGLMQISSAMENAQVNGFNPVTAEGVANSYRSSDYVNPNVFDYRNVSSNNFYDKHKSTIAMLNKTQANVRNKNTKEYGKLNNYLSLDSMSSAGTNIWAKRNSQASEMYNAKKALGRERKQRQMEAQRALNQQFGNSPINHQRM